MAKKKGESDSFSFSAMFDIIKGLMTTLIFDQAKSWVQERIIEFQSSIYTTTKRVLESFLAMSLMIVGVVIIIISLPFLLSYYLNLPASLFFVFMGLIVIIISLVAFHTINKTKYENLEE